jgi:hypothetical protein
MPAPRRHNASTPAGHPTPRLALTPRLGYNAQVTFALAGHLVLHLPAFAWVAAWATEGRLRDYRSPGSRIACGRGVLLDGKVWLYVLCAFLCQQGTRWPSALLVWCPLALSWSLLIRQVLNG